MLHSIHQLLLMGRGVGQTPLIQKNEVNTALATKQNTITGGATTVLTNNLSTNKVLVSYPSGKMQHIRVYLVN